MMDRTTALLVSLPSLVLLPACAGLGSTAEVRDVMSSDEQSALTPESVLQDLKAGNERFVAGRSTDRDLLAQAASTASGQYPKAVVLSCLDSRVVPEVAFDQGIGDLFVGRIAGNFENEDMLGSLEFGTAAAGAKLIVVLGHSSCGAVKGAAAGVELGHLTGMLEHFDGALDDAAARVAEPHDATNPAFVAAAVEANVRRTVEDIGVRSDVIADLVARGQVRIVGAVYDLPTGRVTWL